MATPTQEECDLAKLGASVMHKQTQNAFSEEHLMNEKKLTHGRWPPKRTFLAQRIGWSRT